MQATRLLNSLLKQQLAASQRDAYACLRFLTGLGGSRQAGISFLDKRELHQLRAERKATNALFARSLGLTTEQWTAVQRGFFTASCKKARKANKGKSGVDKPKSNDAPPSNSNESKPEQKPSESEQTEQASAQRNKPNEKHRERSRQEEEEAANERMRKKEKLETLRSVATKTVLWFFAIYAGIIILTVAFAPTRVTSGEAASISPRYVSWNEFMNTLLPSGEIKELIVRPAMDMVTIVLYDNAVIKGKAMRSKVFYMSVADVSKFEDKVRDLEKRLGLTEHVSITYDRQADAIARLVTLLFICGVLMFLVTRLRNAKTPFNMNPMASMSRADFTLVLPSDQSRNVFFSDVAGLKEAKQEVQEFVDYLKSPDKYKSLGAKVPKGALLLGPPGCGKTLLAKAVATEAGLPFLSMNGSEFIEMIGGLGAARVRNLFEQAKKHLPCIIYIDEIDAIGRQRSGTDSNSSGSNSESEQTLNQLLVEMDGMASSEGVLILASTNRADILDKALLRPGRFDRQILIDLPMFEERKEIFEKHLSSVKLEEKAESYSERLARLTPGFSGADIANVCNEAALHAASNLQKVVTSKDLEYAMERTVGGTEKRSHALTPAERKIVAYHESGHALVGWMLPNSDVLLKVTIVPRTNLALGFAQYTPTEQQLYTVEQLFDKMCMALGGRMAEELVFGSVTTGAQNDLDKVTKIAYSMIKKYGMSEKIGPMRIHDSEETGKFYEPYSQALKDVVDSEARVLINRAAERTAEVLNANRDKLKTLAEALYEKETLNYDEVVKLIGPPANDPAERTVDPVAFEQSLNELSEDTRK